MSYHNTNTFKNTWHCAIKNKIKIDETVASHLACGWIVESAEEYMVGKTKFVKYIFTTEMSPIKFEELNNG